MEGLRKGTIIELNDGVNATVEKVCLEKKEITFSENRDGQSIPKSCTVEDFFNQLHPSSRPENGYNLGKGMIFLDTDLATAEVTDMKEDKIEYTKRWGCEVWTNTMSSEDFENHFEKGSIVIF